MNLNIATIISKIGEGVNMDYTPSESGTTSEEAYSYFKRAGYSNAKLYTSYSDEVIISELNANRPVYIAAISPINTLKGHAWIIDGYKTFTITISIPEILVYLFGFPSTWTGPARLLHCNFGWGGLADGYYLSNLFAEYYKFDENTGLPLLAGEMIYNQSYRIIKTGN
jgi:hypothetical protein